MDINKEWERINRENFSSQPINKSIIMEAIRKESSLTIYQLKKRLKYKINWILFFMIAFGVGIILSWKVPAAMLIFGLCLVLYFVGYLLINRQYQQMEDHIDPNKSALKVMKQQANSMKKALRYEHVFGLLGIPILTACGVFLPDLYKGIPFHEILADANGLLLLLGIIVVFTPLVTWFGNKLNDIAYGTFLRELKEQIRKMEELV